MGLGVRGADQVIGVDLPGLPSPLTAGEGLLVERSSDDQ